MKKKTKLQYENEFVNDMILIGISSHIAMYENNKIHYEFKLKDGRVRYWTNMSDENLKKLGIIER